jgi:hypothetical protein
MAAGIGILTLLWSAMGWFGVIDNNVNQVWGVDKPRSFIKSKLFALAMVSAIGGVALLSWVATAAVGIMATFTDIIPGAALLWQAAISAMSTLTMAGAFFVLYRYTPRRKIELADVWPAALATAVLWEVTRRLLAFYLEKNNMISGYGPIGAAMALVFWLYVACIIILVGAEIAYAIAKERRHIGPRDEMQVVAPPGEQPTPKFAPQIGEGFEDRDAREPIRSRPSTHSQPALAASGPTATRQYRAIDGRSSPATNTGAVKKLLWTGLAAGSFALTDLVARSSAAAAWQAMTGEEPPPDKSS